MKEQELKTEELTEVVGGRKALGPGGKILCPAKKLVATVDSYEEIPL